MAIDEFDAIQWVPTTNGDIEAGHWREVVKKTFLANKKIQLLRGGFDVLDFIVGEFGTGPGIHHHTFCMPIEKEYAVRKNLARYGID